MDAGFAVRQVPGELHQAGSFADRAALMVQLIHGAGVYPRTLAEGTIE